MAGGDEAALPASTGFLLGRPDFALTEREAWLGRRHIKEHTWLFAVE